jgi:hypothetical protein
VVGAAVLADQVERGPKLGCVPQQFALSKIVTARSHQSSWSEPLAIRAMHVIVILNGTMAEPRTSIDWIRLGR